jgi:homoserine O-acetyltransferase/O-succinyltransferase
LNTTKDNAVWIFHALTANSNPLDWWPGLVGPDNFIDPAKYFIICVNMPGSCYGSMGPLDEDPQTGRPFFHDFPFFTTRDMARAYRPLKDFLGIEKIFLGIGGSMGGQQLLEWAIEEPALFQNIVPLATNAIHSPWGKAYNASQRLCIEADPTWQERQERAGISGMKVARSVALLSYRHPDTYKMFQDDSDMESLQDFKSESYQRYQGEKLAKRFNAFSYYKLSQSMDAHHVGRERGGAAAALARIKARTCIIGIKNDLLFTAADQEFLALHIPEAEFFMIPSAYGHDGFLLEYNAIRSLAGSFLSERKIVV